MGFLPIPDAVAVFFVLLVTLPSGPYAAGFRVDEESGSLPCPPDKPPVQCVVAPCSVTKCPSFPSATCVDDYCGGCFAKFFLGGKEVTKYCNGSPSEDSMPKPPGRCFLKPDPGPCEGAFPRYFYNWLTKECKSFTYGGCQGNANNFETLEDCEAACVSGKDVSTTTSVPCPPDKPYTPCFAQPCSVNTCPNFPSAICVDDYCGGCFARYFLGNTEVTKFCNCKPSGNP